MLEKSEDSGGPGARQDEAGDDEEDMEVEDEEEDAEEPDVAHRPRGPPRGGAGAGELETRWPEQRRATTAGRGVRVRRAGGRKEGRGLLVTKREGSAPRPFMSVNK